MLDELRNNRLEVCVIGNCRKVVATNCSWYRELCGSYVRPRGRWRKPRTVIRRCTTEGALKRMIAGNLSGVYAERILAVMVSQGMTDPVASDVSNGS